jgi:hypothetical protein
LLIYSVHIDTFLVGICAKMGLLETEINT